MKVIDSHTEGEPTRLVLEGGPDLGTGPMSERLQRLSQHHDAFRQSVVLEPRGSDVLVGALLCSPHRSDCDAGVIFFNNSGYLGMCGHGALGVAITLQHLGRVHAGQVVLDTPVGAVRIQLQGPNQAAVENVASYVSQSNVSVNVPGLGTVTGDVAWGGNWFFLVQDAPMGLRLAQVDALTQAAKAVKQTLAECGIQGTDGAAIDHIEFFADPEQPGADSKNFVLCPGDAYDRSPCGTGTSAKMASLAAKGVLKPGDKWVQESIIGSQFTGWYRAGPDGTIIPTIQGRAFVSAESTLCFHPDDPFKCGINGG